MVWAVVIIILCWLYLHWTLPQCHGQWSYNEGLPLDYTLCQPHKTLLLYSTWVGCNRIIITLLEPHLCVEIWLHSTTFMLQMWLSWNPLLFFKLEWLLCKLVNRCIYYSYMYVKQTRCVLCKRGTLHLAVMVYRMQQYIWHMHGLQIWVTVLESHGIQSTIRDVGDWQGLLLWRVEVTHHSTFAIGDAQVLTVHRTAEMK